MERALEQSPIEKVLRASILREKPVAITLENRKVYIGYVVAGPDPTQEIKAIQILPLASGFRDKDDLQLALTTDYAAIYTAESDRLATRDFVIVLPIARVMSLSIFDMAAYARFQRQARPRQQDGGKSEKSSKLG